MFLVPERFLSDSDPKPLILLLELPVLFKDGFSLLLHLIKLEHEQVSLRFEVGDDMVLLEDALVLVLFFLEEGSEL